MEIYRTEARFTSQTRYYFFELNINNKNVEISFWLSQDTQTDFWWQNGWEILNDVDLTEEEKNAIEDYILSMDPSKIE